MQASNTMPKSGWRYRLGMTLFFGAFPIFFAAPILVPMLGLSTAESVALIGGILMAVEVLWFISIPLLGKKGFNDVKKRAFGSLSFVSKPASKLRHTMGVWLLLGTILLSVLLNLALMILDLVVADPAITLSLMGMSQNQMTVLFSGLQAISTLGVIIGVLMLGSDFWERLRHAFVWQPPKEA